MSKGDCLAVIPARGGSKGILRKNLRRIHGQPLLGWTVTAALRATGVGRVVVSTDDSEIAEVSALYGAEVVQRPADISGDRASSEASLIHVLDHLQRAEGYSPELVVFLQCTSPLTTAEDIDGTIDSLRRESADTALAVVPFHYFLWRRDEKGCGVGVNHSKTVRKLRQDHQGEDAQYLEAGAVYVMRVEGFRKHQHRFFGKTVLYEMPAERRWEIDEPVDLKVAEVLMENMHRYDLAKALPSDIRLVVFDFDGVFTDNRVLVSQDGTESVLCDRGDGMGIERLRQAGVPAMILSKEINPVVAARACKVGLPVEQAVSDKRAFLEEYSEERGIPMDSIVYVGNDVNDLGCMEIVGCAVAVADAYPEVRKVANLQLTHGGGRGAIRELADLILSRKHFPLDVSVPDAN